MRASILRSFWRVHKCRRRILRRLEPFMNRRRTQGHASASWDDAAALGFLVALITLRAQRYAGSLDANALASLQSTLWGRLTGLPPATLGERVVALSAAADPRFLEGSHRARLFEAALGSSDETMQTGPGFDPAGDAAAFAGTGEREALVDLWDRLLADLLPDPVTPLCQEFPDVR